jgi:hypothetical protein
MAGERCREMQFFNFVSPTRTLASAKWRGKASEMHSCDRLALRVDCRKAKYAVRSVHPFLFFFHP